MKNRIKIAIVTVVVLLSGVVGAFVQKYIFTDKEVQQIIKSNEFTTDEIVVVNLDEGIQNGDTRVNYGNELLAKINVVAVGLEEARSGVINGVYAGYVIIPENFSNSVDSINLTNPEAAILKYEFSENLNKAAQKASTEKIQGIEDTLNYEIGYMYLTSILKEVHDGQAQATTVMQNDQAALDAVNAIQSLELITMVKISELNSIEADASLTVETDILALNYQAIVAEMKLITEESKKLFTNEYTTIESSVKELKEEKFNWSMFYDEDGNVVYDAQKMKTDIFNEIGKNVNNVANKSIDTAVDTTSSNIKAEMDKVADISVIHANDYNTMKNEITKYCYVTVPTTSNPNPDYDADKCQSAVYNEMHGDKYLTTIDPSTFFPTTMDDGAGNQVALNDKTKEDVKAMIKADTDVKASMDYTIDAIITVDSTTNEINGGYIKADLLNSLQDHYKKFTTELNDLNKKVDNVESTMNILSVEKIISQTNSSLESELVNINGNTASLLKEVEMVTKKYNANQKEVETEANQTISEISTNVTKSQQESNDNIENGLKNAKETTSTTLSNNTELLSRFTSKLKNTKYGETQSKEVKDHILNPTTKDGDGVNSPSIAATTTAKEDFPMSLVYVGGIGTILLLLTAGYIVFSKKSTKE